MPPAPLQCIKIKNRSWCQYKLCYINKYIFIIQIIYSILKGFQIAKNMSLGLFFKKANHTNKTNPNLFKYLNDMDNTEKGKKGP